MRFMMIIKSDAQAEAGVMPDEKLLTEMGNFNEAMLKAGVLLGGDGLHASARGARVIYKHGKFSVLDGPFAEAKELVAGFWLIQAKDKAQAVEWAKRIPSPQPNEPACEIEIRQIFEPSDFV